MRPIDADALRKNAQHAKDISKWYGELFVVGLGHILNAPTISPRPDWTPCADGLPEIMKRVIVTICGEIVIAEREHELDDDETTPIHWYDDEGCRFTDDVVTAWIPLPEPWTGGLDGK